MKKVKIIFGILIVVMLSFLFTCKNTSGSEGVKIISKPVSVAILGTYHMSGKKGGGMFELQVDDVKTLKRQKEIKRVVSKLLQYNPTKVLIESAYGNDHYVKRYKKFLNHRNEEDLSRNEIEQIAFRLSAQLNHKKIYPFDFKRFLNTDKLQKFINQNPRFSKKFKDWIAQAGKFFKKVNNNLKTKTILEYLKYSNSEEAIHFHHQANLELLRYGKDDNYAGVDYNLAWYERNMKMFHNLTRITDFDNKNERILILVGEAHVKILKNFIVDAYYYQYVDILGYL